jgi:hypothetical protein
MKKITKQNKTQKTPTRNEKNQKKVIETKVKEKINEIIKEQMTSKGKINFNKIREKLEKEGYKDKKDFEKNSIIRILKNKTSEEKNYLFHDGEEGFVLYDKTKTKTKEEILDMIKSIYIKKAESKIEIMKLFGLLNKEVQLENKIFYIGKENFEKFLKNNFSSDFSIENKICEIINLDQKIIGKQIS